MDIAAMKMFTALAMICALILGYFTWHDRVDKQGYDRAEKIYQEREADAKTKADAVLFKANENVRVAQASLQETRDMIIAKNQELENAKAIYDKLHGDYVLGVKRLSVRSSCPRSPAEQGNGAAVASGSGEARTDLLPEDAASVLDAARGSAEDVRKLNTCIGLYNAVRDAVNRP